VSEWEREEYFFLKGVLSQEEGGEERREGGDSVDGRMLRGRRERRRMERY
jgi:hypothetical protein